jgi:hypothetical protein
MSPIFDFLFPKKCPGCQKVLHENSKVVCEACSIYLNVAIRHECAVCSRDFSSCKLCYGSFCFERVLATFEPSSCVEKLLKKAQTMAGWRLEEAITDAMWLKLVTSAEPLFDEVRAMPEPIWGLWKSLRLNDLLAKSFSKKLKIKPYNPWRLTFQKKEANQLQKKILVVAALASEKDVCRMIQSCDKEASRPCLTFLIGSWRQ